MKALWAATVMIAVAGCNKPDPRICSSLAMQVLPGQSLDSTLSRLQVTESCVERWAARLATGPDSVTEVATGAIGACDKTFYHLRRQQIKEYGATEPLGEMREFWQRRAKFVALQVRAGNCHPEA